MDIRTARIAKELEDPDAAPSPDKSLYLRKKATPHIRKSYHVNRVVLRGLRLGAQVTLGLGVAGLAVWMAIYAYSSERFTLKTIGFAGCRHLDCAALEASLRKELPVHTLQVDLERLRERIERETWVRRAEIRRILPSELDIYVQERVPLVILELRGELMLADEEGVLLDKYGSRYGKLDVPVFKGFLGNGPEGYRQNQEENAERVRLGLRMLAELESGSSDYTRNISEVDLSDMSDVRIILVDDTAEIQIGDRDFLKRFNKLMANVKEYQELKGQYGEFASVDLRFESQIAYRRRDAAGGKAEVRRSK